MHYRGKTSEEVLAFCLTNSFQPLMYFKGLKSMKNTIQKRYIPLLVYQSRIAIGESI